MVDVREQGVRVFGVGLEVLLLCLIRVDWDVDGGRLQGGSWETGIEGHSITPTNARHRSCDGIWAIRVRVSRRSCACERVDERSRGEESNRSPCMSLHTLSFATFMQLKLFLSLSG